MHARPFWTLSLFLALALSGCSEGDAPASAAASPEATDAVEMPLTTSSDEARAAYLEGMSDFDMGRGPEAEAHFAQAVQLDPDFALAHAMLAAASTGPAAFEEHLSAAENAADGASRGEQLLISAMRKGSSGDPEGALADAQALTEELPSTPRAWEALAFRQAALNRHAEARQSLDRALELDPGFTPAHLTLSQSYATNSPRDLAKAEEHARAAVEQLPDEPNTHDILGDVYRQQGQLEQARDSYSEAARLAPESGFAYQQRGHVNSFLGDYAAARADYDRAIELIDPQIGAGFGTWRALVSVHEGNPGAAIDELVTHAEAIGGMDIENPNGPKMFALSTALQVALHHGMTDRAAEIVDQVEATFAEWAPTSGSEAFERNAAAASAYWAGLLAAEQGDYAEAEAQVAEIERVLEPDPNPRKLEGAHEIQGVMAYKQGDHAEAAGHFRQADLENDVYVRYRLAQALEEAGETEEAMALYEEIGSWYFNSAGTALARATALEKTSARS